MENQLEEISSSVLYQGTLTVIYSIPLCTSWELQEEFEGLIIPDYPDLKITHCIRGYLKSSWENRIER